MIINDGLALPSGTDITEIHCRSMRLSCRLHRCRHWGVPLSRRFRALKLWFVLRRYGIEGLQAYIRNHCRLAKSFEALVKKDKRFDLVNDVRVSRPAEGFSTASYFQWCFSSSEA